MKIKIPKIIRTYLKAGTISGLVMIVGLIIIVVVVKMPASIFDPIYRLFNQYLPGSKNGAIDSIYLIIFSLSTTLLIFMGLGAAITAVKNKRGGITKIISSLIIKLPFVKHFIVSEETRGQVVCCKSALGLDVLGYEMKRVKYYHLQKQKWVDAVSILVPNSPMPWSGYTHLVSVEDVRAVWVIDQNKQITRMTRIECGKIIISGGLTTPPTLIFSELDASLSEVQKILQEHK